MTFVLMTHTKHIPIINWLDYGTGTFEPETDKKDYDVTSQMIEKGHFFSRFSLAIPGIRRIPLGVAICLLHDALTYFPSG
jgi:hypothetical protein